MPGRKFNTPDYRYGLNGQEKDNEINGIDGAYTSAEYWEYDTRLGRRWNRDPIVKSWESPFATFGNNPIYYNDPSGLDKEKAKEAKKKNDDTKAGIINQGETYIDADGHSFTYDKDLGWQMTSQISDGSANSHHEKGTVAIIGFAPAIPIIAEGIIAAIEAIITTLIGKAAIDKVKDIPWTMPEHESGDWIVYKITSIEVDLTTGIPVSSSVYKYGISGQAAYSSKPGHPRPELQVNALNATETMLVNDGAITSTRYVYSYTIIASGISQLSAEFIEQEMINLHYTIHAEAPDGNKRPIPDALRGRTRAKFEKLTPKDIEKIKKFIDNISNTN